MSSGPSVLPWSDTTNARSRPALSEELVKDTHRLSLKPDRTAFHDGSEALSFIKPEFGAQQSANLFSCDPPRDKFRSPSRCILQRRFLATL